MFVSLGKLNRQNPGKITSDTGVQNPVMMAALFFYNRNYQDLTSSEQSNLYKKLNSIEKDENGNLLFDKGLNSAELGNQVKNTKKKLSS